MRRFIQISFCFLIFTVMTVPTTGAQENWRFAWDSVSGMISAYSTTGTVNSLVVADEVFPVSWRLNTGEELTLLSVDEAVGLFHMTPTAAIPLTLTSEPSLPMAKINTLAARSDPYLVLVIEVGASAAGLLVDMNAKTVTPLTGESYVTIDGWRFSADGQYLRYLSRDTAQGQIWTIRERHLATGEETELYRFNATFPLISADADGSNWLYRTLEEGEMRHILVRGKSATVIAEEQNLDLAHFTSYQLLKDGRLLVYTAQCTQDCQFHTQTAEGDLLQAFPILAIASPEIFVIGLIGESQLVILIENQFWLLKDGQPAMLLGILDGANMLTGHFQLISPDQRLMVVRETASQTFHLLDLETETSLYQAPLGQNFTVHYQDGGALIRQEIPFQTLVYLYSTAQMISLPRQEGGFYFEVMGDGTVLYTQAYATDRQAGIYRYWPGEERFDLLVAGLFPIGANAQN